MVVSRGLKMADSLKGRHLFLFVYACDLGRVRWLVLFDCPQISIGTVSLSNSSFSPDPWLNRNN